MQQKNLRIGDLLLQAGTITEAQLSKGLELQRASKTKERLGTVLISAGIITEDQLIEALHLQLGIDFVDLTNYQIPVDLAQTIPKNIAKQYQMVPFKLVRDELCVAISDPLNFYATEEAKKASKKKIVLFLARASAIEYAIQSLYSNEGASKAIEEMRREAQGKQTQDVYADTVTVNNTQIDDSDLNSAPIIRLVNSIIDRAVTERASDIHIEPQEDGVVVRMRIDGVLRDMFSFPREHLGAVVSRIKVMSGLDVTERRIPQDGRTGITLKGGEIEIDLRISTLPTINGEKVVMRILDKTGRSISHAAIGLEGADLEKYEKLLKISAGVILVVGPTGSGKSTTMYTMINELNQREVNLVSLEDPVEYQIKGVNQVAINDKVGMTFASGLRAILRQDPDVIAVGEIRDGETAEIAMRSAITGHVVLSTIHTNDSIGTIERLENIGVEPYLVASALKGVISQRLVRRICRHCIKPYTPDAAELGLLGIDDGKPHTFYKGEGCPECFKTGYRGRIAVFEILPINQKIREIIEKGGGRAEIEAVVHAEGSDFVSLRENAIRLVEAGITTASEVLRVSTDIV